MRKTALTLCLLAACVRATPAPRAQPHLTAALPDAATSAPAHASATTVDAAVEPDPVAVFSAADETYGGETVAEPYPADNICQIADSNLATTARAILARASANANSATPAPPPAPWDHRAAPGFLANVERRLHLRPAERALLYRNGFVVLDRVAFDHYADALHMVYQSQLPMYVSVDAVLHAVYRSNDELIGDIEEHGLGPLLDRTLARLHDALPAAADDYPPEVAHDLDVYLTVARTLLTSRPVRARLDGDAEAAPLVSAAQTAAGLGSYELFGRDRMIDFGRYRPRGHYATRSQLDPYFRAAMWLSNLEFNLLSRSSRSSQPGQACNPEETPREATVALALADLVSRSGTVDDVARLDHAWSVLAGRREDVSIEQLTALRARAGIVSLRDSDAAARLRAAIGDGYRRTARVHYMPEGATELPAIATFLGPRITPDTAMLRPIVNDDTPGRYHIAGADVAYAFGHQRARTYLAQDLANFPTLEQQFSRARAVALAPLGDDLYSQWFGAVRGLAQRPEGALPSFMDTDAFGDLRLNSIVAAYGQIRHNYVLMAGQAYDAFGCAIPDSFVEPAPAVYDALIAYSQRGVRAMRELNLPGETGYFERLEHHLRVLRAIVSDELANRPLTADERNFLGLVAEALPGSSGGGPTYTGWYFDLFRNRQDDGLARADFIADYYTSTTLGEVAYAGAQAPRLAVFVVDTAGAPRAMVGPVARAYDYHGPLSPRLTDEEARALSQVERPWAASYSVAPGAIQPLSITVAPSTHHGDAEGTQVVTVRSPRPLPRGRVELLDHHYVPYQTTTIRAGARVVSITAPPAEYEDGPELTGVRVVVPSGEATLRHEDFERGLYVGGLAPPGGSATPPASATTATNSGAQPR